MVISMKNLSKHFKNYHSFNRKSKRIKKLNKRKDKKTYFDKLYIRIFLSSLLLLILIGGKNLLKLSIIDNINNNMNILPILNLFTNMNDFNINDLPVDLITNYENIEYSKGINYITNESFNGVATACSGIVVKIVKHNHLYEVTIKTEDDLEYIYRGLASVDVYLYSYVVVNNTIGTASFNNQKYTFNIEIKDDKASYSLLNLNNAED